AAAGSATPVESASAPGPICSLRSGDPPLGPGDPSSARGGPQERLAALDPVGGLAVRTGSAPRLGPTGMDAADRSSPPDCRSGLGENPVVLLPLGYRRMASGTEERLRGGAARVQNGRAPETRAGLRSDSGMAHLGAVQTRPGYPPRVR